MPRSQGGKELAVEEEPWKATENTALSVTVEEKKMSSETPAEDSSGQGFVSCLGVWVLFLLCTYIRKG